MKHAKYNELFISPELINEREISFNLCFVFLPNMSHKVSIHFFLVHRIGRTGRGSAKGVATTFVNQSCGESQ